MFFTQVAASYENFSLWVVRYYAKILHQSSKCENFHHKVRQKKLCGLVTIDPIDSQMIWKRVCEGVDTSLKDGATLKIIIKFTAFDGLFHSLQKQQHSDTNLVTSLTWVW